jgi:hypothetical protein
MAEAQAEFDKWDTFIRNHPEHIAEVAREAEAWCEQQKSLNEAALREMRSFVPKDIWHSSLTQLKSLFATAAATADAPSAPPSVVPGSTIQPPMASSLPLTSSSFTSSPSKANLKASFEDLAKRVWQRKVELACFHIDSTHYF